MSAVQYEGYAEAQSHLKDLLDAATDGVVATVRRDGERLAIVDADRLRCALSRLFPSNAEAVSENGGWSVALPGLPAGASGATFDEAVDEMADELREYAEDWQSRLRVAPNHRENWGIVQLIGLSDDVQLRGWLLGDAADSRLRR
ncbi:O-acetyl-ADP-ribose deacetylase (regulator of RNase III) [Nocardia transvalensis]|uniref:O-acetyl-ADP-ribose deacetylase (Regulator of RNase III) n=1 Tax=Nocardia transvalensis TaxID=37333 RepID=A0A7W9PC38_9NOCA|nr:prevent-host-death protein [Nocardia transvalensis]MBB5912938.1 O-acetyl-ADP-ribose deacetylase (regulator of RNase III) [Nocardia transvalensis]